MKEALSTWLVCNIFRIVTSSIRETGAWNKEQEEDALRTDFSMSEIYGVVSNT